MEHVLEMGNLNQVWEERKEAGQTEKLVYENLAWNGETVMDANLSKIVFSQGEMQGMYFQDCNFDYCTFTGCKLNGCTFLRCSMRFVDMTDVFARSTSLNTCDLHHTNLNDTVWSHGRWTNCDLTDAYLDSFAPQMLNTSGSNIVFLGFDSRGYLFYCFKDDGGILRIRAGCRNFIGVEKARYHWKKHEENEDLHTDIRSMLQRAVRVAKQRGWQVEP